MDVVYSASLQSPAPCAIVVIVDYGDGAGAFAAIAPKGNPKLEGCHLMEILPRIRELLQDGDDGLVVGYLQPTSDPHRPKIVTGGGS